MLHKYHSTGLNTSLGREVQSYILETEELTLTKRVKKSLDREVAPHLSGRAGF